MSETKAVAKKPVNQVEVVRASFNQMASQFQACLPSNVTPEKFIRVTMTAIQNTPKLLEATRQSLYSAAMKCAADGLLPDGREAALIPFKDQVQYMPMTAGILKKVRNSGELSSISPHVVYEKDEFDFWVDEKGEHIKHKPNLLTDRGEAKFAYAVAVTKDGSAYIEVMSKEEIEKARNDSRSKDGPAWKDWWGEMARKTVIKRLSKRLPMSTDLEQVLDSDDALNDYNKGETPEPEAPKTKSARLSEVVESQVEEPDTEKKDEELPV